jgi:DinB superfamily
MKRPADVEYATYYSTYVSLVPEADVITVLERQPQELRDLTGGLTTDRETFRYAAGKWSIRETIGHIIDTERVFGHRAFCISRGEAQPLPGFDQNDYMAASDFDKQPLTDLVKEFAIVREANLLVLRRLHDADWDRAGSASGHPVSVRALAFMMAGHVRHHCRILGERYGLKG